MKNTLRQVFHSPKFVVGFGIFVFILLIMLIYPMFNPGNPLEMIGVGTFASPGTYVSLYDAVGTDTETLRLSDADDNRIAKALSAEDRVAMVEWFTAMGIDVSGLDINRRVGGFVERQLRGYRQACRHDHGKAELLQAPE